MKAAQQRAVIPLEDRVQQFKAMLAEKEVTQVQNFVCFHSSHGIQIFILGFRFLNMGKRITQNRFRFPIFIADIQRK